MKFIQEEPELLLMLRSEIFLVIKHLLNSKDEKLKRIAQNMQDFINKK